MNCKDQYIQQLHQQTYIAERKNYNPQYFAIMSNNIDVKFVVDGSNIIELIRKMKFCGK